MVTMNAIGRPNLTLSQASYYPRDNPLNKNEELSIPRLMVQHPHAFWLVVFMCDVASYLITVAISLCWDFVPY